MKFTLQGFYLPTPKKMRQIGDILLGISGVVSAIALHYNSHAGAEIAFWLGIGSKFITNCFVDNGNA